MPRPSQSSRFYLHNFGRNSTVASLSFWTITTWLFDRVVRIHIHVAQTHTYIHIHGDRDSSVGIATTLRTGRSGDRILVKARFSATVQIRPVAHPAPCTTVTGPFAWVKRQERDTVNPPSSSAGLRMPSTNTSAPPLSACPGMSWGDLYLTQTYTPAWMCKDLTKLTAHNMT
jgi:hypothetical protein